MDCPDCGANVRMGARFCMECGAMVAALSTITVNVMPEQWTAAHSPRAPRTTAPNDKYIGSAARIPRLIAWLIDGIIVVVAGFVYVGVTGIELVVIDDAFLEGRASFPEINWVPFVPLWIAQAAYYIVFPATAWMGTPGKKLFALEITNCEGEPIGILHSLWRYVCQVLVLCLVVPVAMLVVPFGLVVVPIVLVIVLAPAHDQSPWDMLAGTRVQE